MVAAIESRDLKSPTIPVDDRNNESQGGNKENERNENRSAPIKMWDLIRSKRAAFKRNKVRSW